MPNTFVAQGYDIGEPWDGLGSCVKGKTCCRSFNHFGENCASPPCRERNTTTCPDGPVWDRCKAYCEGQDSPVNTSPFMGGKLFVRSLARSLTWFR